MWSSWAVVWARLKRLSFAVCPWLKLPTPRDTALHLNPLLDQIQRVMKTEKSLAAARSTLRIAGRMARPIRSLAVNEIRKQIQCTTAVR